MTVKSWHVKRFRLKRKKYELLLRCFLSDITALQSAKIALVAKDTASRYFRFFRRLLAQAALLERKTYLVANGVEIDESYFGPKRVRGRRGRGAGRKIVVLGLMKRQGKVFTHIIPRASKKAILPIIRRTVRSGSDIYTDGWSSYDALAIYGYNHKQVMHHKDEFVRGKDHINGIESFWSWTKRRLARYNGLKRSQFFEFLLESEYRFNHRNDLSQKLKKLISEYKLSTAYLG